MCVTVYLTFFVLSVVVCTDVLMCVFMGVALLCVRVLVGWHVFSVVMNLVVRKYKHLKKGIF